VVNLGGARGAGVGHEPVPVRRQCACHVLGVPARPLIVMPSQLLLLTPCAAAARSRASVRISVVVRSIRSFLFWLVRRPSPALLPMTGCARCAVRRGRRLTQAAKFVRVWQAAVTVRLLIGCCSRGVSVRRLVGGAGPAFCCVCIVLPAGRAPVGEPAGSRSDSNCTAESNESTPGLGRGAQRGGPHRPARGGQNATCGPTRAILLVGSESPHPVLTTLWPHLFWFTAPGTASGAGRG
jgi:hypothetical protein